jgi:hypothetical protein
MGIEFLLPIVVFLAQKVGEAWIQQIATGISSRSYEKLKEVIYDPTKEQEVKDYFRDNPTEAEKVGQNVASTMQSPEIVASIAAAIVPSSGDILKYYAELINWIVRHGRKLERHFVLKGFLNGEFYLSYFIFDRSKLGNSAFARVVEPRRIGSIQAGGHYVSIRSTGTGEGLYVEKMKSAEDRDKKFAEMNMKAMLSSRGTLRPSDYFSANQVSQIYPHYVWYEQPGNISERSSKQQAELAITTTKAPVQAMLQSLWELLEFETGFLQELAQVLEELKKIHEGVES